MNVQNMLKYTADLSQGVTLTPLRMAFVRGEAQAHMFIITAYENNQKVDLTGAKVNGYMMRSDQTTLTFEGSVANGNAVISLPGAAYSVTGRFRLAIQATVNGMTTTLFYGEGAVSPSTTDVIAIPEEILMPSLENIEAQVEEMVAATAAAKAAAQGAVVRNLLDNSDFRNPINQRGASIYTSAGSAIHTIDRWIIDGTNVVLSVNTSGVHIDNTADNNTNRAFYQRLPVGTIIAGEAYTGVIGLTDGTIYCGHGIAATTSVNLTTNSNDAYFQILAGTIYDSARIVVKKGKTSSVAYCALYKGSYTAETLPAYQPKGYAAELAECQRYYYKVKGYWKVIATGISTSETTAQIPFNLPQAMRIMPTINIPNTALVKIKCGSQAAQTPSALSWGYGNLLYDNLAVVATVTGTKNGDVAVLYLDDGGTIEFSAEL